MSEGQHQPLGQRTQLDSAIATNGLRFNPSFLPGLAQEDWPNVAKPGRPFEIPYSEWRELGHAARIGSENNAVRSYLGTKDEAYRIELARVAALIPEMPAEQSVNVVIPAYNEDATIGPTLYALLQTASSSEIASWGITVVVNRPLRSISSASDAERDTREAQALEATIETIEEIRRQFPALDLQYVVVEPPAAVAGVGLARALGHDLVALRSLNRDEAQRSTPLYVQTLDADTVALNPNFISVVLSHLRDDQYQRDFFRQRTHYPVSDMKQHPLLHAMNFFWVDTISTLSRHTDMAWTTGAATLVSLHASAATGGVIPFRFTNGVDEDIRIGTAIRLRRGMGNPEGQGEIPEPLVFTDPSRALLGVKDILRGVQSSGLTEGRGYLTRDMHEMARLIKYWRNFDTAALEQIERSGDGNLSWLESQEAFEAAVPPVVLEVLANSFRELAREGLVQQFARGMSPRAAEIYSHFSEGRTPFCAMSDEFTVWERSVRDSAANTEDPAVAELREVFERASVKATQLVIEIMRSHGIEAHEALGVDLTPPGPEADAPVPWAINVRSTAGYREDLQRYFGLV